MPSWSADQYLKFAAERTQPARDLLARIQIDQPAQVIDLGCGPGNSTALLAERWPAACTSGLDNSATMIAQAKRDYPGLRWIQGGITAWASEARGSFDVVFSNAALQWVPDHKDLYPSLLRHVAPGGALAVQAPMNLDAPAQVLMRELASTPAWAGLLPPGGVRGWHMEEAGYYYDLLAPSALRVDLWLTEYIHVTDSPTAIVEWYKGTGLRPFLDALPSDADRINFLANYTDRISEAYPMRSDGCVLFPFRRFFLIAYR